MADKLNNNKDFNKALKNMKEDILTREISGQEMDYKQKNLLSEKAKDEIIKVK